MGMILRIASSRIVGQGDIVGRSGYFSLNLSANSVMRGRLDARRTLKSLVADLRVEELEMKKISGPIRLCSKTRIKSNKNQERFVIVQKSQEYDKTWNIYRVYYLLQQDDDMVHCVTIRMRENYAKKNPGKIEEIKRILDSFTIKGER